jgi:hypothetical protein
MIKIKHTFAIIVLFFFSSAASFAQRSKYSGNGIRINFGPVLGFYTINTNHASSPIQKMSAVVGFKRERRISRDYKTFFLSGIDYFFHGLNFQSYYFKKDSLKIYDKNFNYTYSVFIHELNLPLQFKYLLRSENNSLFSPYVSVGYHLRYLLPGKLKVSQNGNVIKEDDSNLKFKNPLILKELNAFVSLSIGWQKNSLTTSKGSFFAEINYRYAFSPVFFEHDYSASSLFINSTHAALLLGLKF